MERCLMSTLYEWKDSKNRKPLILEGARQVGKTYLLRAFAKQAYKQEAYVSCDKNDNVAALFSGDFNIPRIIRGLSALTSVDIEPENTLIILDEIQECPQALHALKYFCEDAPQYSIIVAGSLLGLSLHEHESFPVGKVDTLQLFPMTFEEFLQATRRAQLAECLRSGDWALINSLHASFCEALREYYYVGGMPAAVLSYVQDQSLTQVRLIQKSILKDYARDFSKHTTSEVGQRIRLVWENIPSQLAKENKKFIYGVLKKGARAKDFELAIEWLLHAGLIYKVPRVTKTQFPLRFYAEPEVFKLFVLDVGLMGAMADITPDQILVQNSLMTEYKGAFTELYALTQLQAHAEQVYYHSTNDSQCELDFVIQHGDKIIPIEVKAEENVHSRSLTTFLQKNPNLQAVRLSMKPYLQQDNITNVPLYAIGIKRKTKN